ncbi:MAG: hypothetical protein JW965_04735 [Bacteroidales bacterium]|nr:hypothetical protein [Bacteroidales bacterium]
MMTNIGKIGNKNPFRVPENYFDEVRKEIYERTTATEAVKGKNRIIRLVKPALMLAAAMIAFAIISYTGLKLLFPEYGKPVEDNYTEFLYQFEEVELINILTEQETDAEIRSAETDEIIDYLLDQDIEYTSIIEFLN